ncbi:hypothetical protein C0V97_17200 [Asaia sp. W19]|uniref:helix-turn-helix domain-containing protein n=1 Tax=unclassified Asaia TaxID=2685023 RepID=UPI000F8E48B0|nr:helix-turn-helix domain-containing protein [Asaia sp. W19]RUT24329.1 hypothetical protein C0V97_17200 [Asaia sp. W19]
MRNFAGRCHLLNSAFATENVRKDRITHINTLPAVSMVSKTIKVGPRQESAIKLDMSSAKSRKNPPTPAAIAMGLRIRTQREHLGFTQAQLGGMIGVTENAIAQYETGRSSPRRERVPALLEALGRSIGWLLTGDEPEEEVKAQTEKEREILIQARDLPPEQQDILLKMISALKN